MAKFNLKATKNESDVTNPIDEGDSFDLVLELIEGEFGDHEQVGQDIDGEVSGDKSGYSVSLSADGTRVAIGAPFNDGNGNDSGHTRIYDYNETETKWQQVGQDIDGEALSDESGWSVSLSADGKRVAIGAPFNGENGHTRIYDYNETETEWQQVGQDIDGEALSDESGWSVSLSADGKRVAIGAPANNGNGNLSGHTRIYDYNETETKWQQVGQDIDGEALSDLSGLSVSLSADGSRVAIGAYLNDGNGSRSGHTRIYDWNGASWEQLGQDIDGEAAVDFSGWSVSLSADGSRVAIGAYLNDGNGSRSGHTRIYDWNGASWEQLGQDIDGEAAVDFSGWSVSLSADGTRVAIGAPFNGENGHTRIYDYIETETKWQQVGQDIDGEVSSDESGWSVSLSADGKRVAIGAPANNGNGNDSGHTRIYEIDGLTTEQPFTVSGTGITTGDFTIDGQRSLSGEFNINKNTNLATKTIIISSDFVDESPQESITFTLDNYSTVSVTVDINDIRKQATLEILNGVTSVNEGQSITFIVTPNEYFDPGETINVSYTNPEKFVYTIDSVTTDVEDPTTPIDFSITPKQDRITEGSQDVDIGIGTSSLELASPVTFTINDTSLSPKIDSFSSDASPYNEGDTVTLNLSGTNLFNGDIIPFTITNEEDFDSPIPTEFIISDNAASVTLTVSKDNELGFSNETVTATLDNSLIDSGDNSFILDPNSVFSTDFIINPSTVTLIKRTDQLNERASPNSIDITIKTKFIRPGTVIPFVLSDSTQFIDPPSEFVVTGTFESGTDTVTLTASDDRTTEGNQTITLTLTGFPDKFISFDIIDDSQDATITLKREPDSFSINEGDSIDFILTTEGLSEGTEFTWKIDTSIANSVSDSDIDGALEGAFSITLDSPETAALDGSDSVTITTIADEANTGNKFIQFNVFDSEDNQVASTQILVFDTSPIRSESIRVNSSVGTNGCVFTVLTQGSTAYSEGDIIDLKYTITDSADNLLPVQKVLIDRTDYFHSPLGQLYFNDYGIGYAVLGSDRKAKNFFYVREDVNDEFGQIKINFEIINNI